MKKSISKQEHLQINKIGGLYADLYALAGDVQAENENNIVSIKKHKKQKATVTRRRIIKMNH